MKRVVFILGLMAGLVASVALVRYQVSTSAVGTEVIRALNQEGSGATVTLGAGDVQLFPRLAVRFADLRVAVAGRAEPALTAREVTANIDLLPLFIGRLNVTDITLDHPHLGIETRFDLTGLVPDIATLAKLHPVSVTVRDGDVTIRAPDGTRVETISNINARLRWPRAEASASLDGGFVWRGETVSLSAQGIAPHQLVAGATGDLDLSIGSRHLQLGFTGKASLGDRLQLDGAITADTDDAARLGAILGVDMPVSLGTPIRGLPGIGAVGLTGRWRSFGWATTISDARLTVDRATAEGVISARIDLPRPQIRGTLAFDRLDLTPLVAKLPLEQWRNWRLPAPLLTSLEIDLRLSVADLVAGSAQFSRVAAGLLVTDGRFHAEIGDAGVLGGAGSIIMRGTVDAGGLKSSGRFTLVGTSAPLTLAMFGLDGLGATRGTVSLLGEFEAEGPTLGAAGASLRGKVSAEALRIGAAGLEAARQIGRRLNAETAGTAVLMIDKVSADLDFSADHIEVQRLDATVGDMRLALSGSAGLASRRLGLTGQAMLARSPAGPASASPRLVIPLTIAGTLDHPVFTPAAEPGVAPATP